MSFDFRFYSSKNPYNMKRLSPKGFKNITENNFSFKGHIGNNFLHCGTKDNLRSIDLEKDNLLFSSISSDNPAVIQTILDRNFYFDTFSKTPVGIRIPNTSQYFYFGKENVRGNLEVQKPSLITNYDFQIGSNPHFHFQIHRPIPFYTLGYTYEDKKYRYYVCYKNKIIKLESCVSLKGLHILYPTYIFMTLNSNNGKVRIGFTHVGQDKALNLHWSIRIPIKDLVFVNTFTALKGYSIGIQKKFNSPITKLSAYIVNQRLSLGASCDIMDNIKANLGVGLNLNLTNFKYDFGIHFNYGNDSTQNPMSN